MTNAAVFHLGEPGEIDPRTVLTGPLSGIRRVRLGADESVGLVADGVEFSFFVLAGTGTATTSATEVPLRQGVSVTAPLHTALRVVAGADGLEYFLVELTVPDRGTT
jgi:mannose-6-phosphate isomerase-like protein (cupin superfamily)